MFPLILRAVVLLIAVLLAGQTFAQPRPRIPTPGEIEREYTPPPALRPPPRNLPAVPALPPVAPPAPELRVVVREIVVEGMTVYSPAELERYLAPLRGKEATLEEINALARELTARYVEDGYFLSRVLVPAQTIEAGRIQLTAIEGYIAEVRFQGAKPEHEGVLRSYANKITATRPIALGVLERYLLLMNDLAGVEARSTLVASPTPGAADLVVDLSVTRGFGQVGGDNRGSRVFGPWRLRVDAELASLTGRFDSTRLFAASTLNSEQNYVLIQHAQPVGGDGGKLAAAFWGESARADLAAVGGLGSSVTRSWAGSLFYNYPVVRSRARNLMVRAGFTAHHGRVDVDGASLAKDRIRTLRVGFTFDAIDRWQGSSIVDLDLAQGLDVLGATNAGGLTPPFATGESVFTKAALYAARLQPLVDGWALFAAVSAQHASRPLPSIERFSFGGEYFGRGYDPSELVGDSGASMKIELRRDLGWLASGAVAVSGYGFYDLGGVSRRLPLGGEARRASAASAGVGLRGQFRGSVYGYVELAKPLTRTVALEGDKDARLYAGLFVSF